MAIEIYFDPSKTNGSVLSNNNLTVTAISSSSTNAKFNIPSKRDVFVVEFYVERGSTSTTTGAITLGIGDSAKRTQYAGCDTKSVGINIHDGNYWHNGTATSTSFRGVTGDYIAIKVDKTANKIEFYRNGSMVYSNIIPFTYDELYIEVGTGGSYGGILTIQPDFFKYKYSYGVGVLSYYSLNKILISLSDGSFASLIKKDASVVSPVMTSNTAPSPYKVTSSASSSGWEGYKAFDGVTNPASGWQATAKNGWIQIDLSIPIKVNMYEIFATNNSTSQRSPKDWTFEGSNDGGATWDVLDTQTNVTGWVSGEKKRFVLSNEKEYRIYKLNISSNGDNSHTYTNLAELKLLKDELPVFKNVESSLEGDFVNQGMDKDTVLEDVDLSRLSWVKRTTTPIGDGKVFSQKIDTSKYILKKANIK